MGVSKLGSNLQFFCFPGRHAEEFGALGGSNSSRAGEGAGPPGASAGTSVDAAGRSACATVDSGGNWVRIAGFFVTIPRKLRRAGTVRKAGCQRSVGGGLFGGSPASATLGVKQVAARSVALSPYCRPVSGETSGRGLDNLFRMSGMRYRRRVGIPVGHPQDACWARPAPQP